MTIPNKANPVHVHSNSDTRLEVYVQTGALSGGYSLSLFDMESGDLIDVRSAPTLERAKALAAAWAYSHELRNIATADCEARLSSAWAAAKARAKP
jgi:hypothetical protein